MRPISSKNFGPAKNKLVVKFHNGTSVVEGVVVKQIGTSRFVVKKDAYTATCNLAQDADDVTALTGGDTTLCMIEFTPFGGALTYVRSLYTKTVVAHDGVRYSYAQGVAATAAGQGTISVAPNHAPTVANAIANQTGTQNNAFSFTVPGNTFADIDAEALTLTATLQNGSALPGWLSFDAAAGTLSGTPSAAGTVLARVTASDGTASANADFTITIS